MYIWGEGPGGHPAPRPLIVLPQMLSNPSCPYSPGPGLGAQWGSSGQVQPGQLARGPEGGDWNWAEGGPWASGPLHWQCPNQGYFQLSYPLPGTLWPPSSDPTA